MTLHRTTSDPKQMTAAALKVVRESLGLTTAWTAERMGVRERTVHRWEAGVSPIPEGVRLEMDYLRILTDDAVEQLVAEVRGQEHPTVLTYRTDADYRAHHPEQPWLASWHRAVVARVARAIDVRIDYWEPPAPA